MNRVLLLASAALTLLVCCSCNDGNSEKAPKPDGFHEVSFDSSDHKKVYADFFPSAQQNSEKVILMFHQAGSNAGEYENMETVASQLGYNCIAVDLRAGGDMWGRENRTASKSGTGEYLDAYKDMQGALEYAHSQNYTTIVVWGSSYSASLALKMAAEETGIKGAIAFSPGEYFDDKTLVKGWASKVSCPVLIACTPDELKDGRQDLYDAITSDPKVLAQFSGGVHGTSTVLPEKSPAAAQYVDKVKDFLTNLK